MKKNVRITIHAFRGSGGVEMHFVACFSVIYILCGYIAMVLPPTTLPGSPRETLARLRRATDTASPTISRVNNYAHRI